MSLTKGNDNKDIVKQFTDKLVNIYYDTDDDISGFILTPDRNINSYYHVRKNRTMHKQDFEINYETKEKLEQLLKKQWNKFNILKDNSLIFTELIFNIEAELVRDEELPSFIYTL